MTAPSQHDTPKSIERAHRNGSVSDEERDEFYWVWRDSTYRFSNLGKREAARHAKANGLKLPSSDRPVVKSEAEARMENYRTYQKGLPAWAKGPA